MKRPVVVVGGGIVGTAIAYTLRLGGVDTILVERDPEPQGASAFSFAALSAFDEPQRDFYLLKTHGLVTWRSWAKEFGESLGVTFTGETRWAESADSAAHLKTMIERALARGYGTHYATESQVLEQEPGARPKGLVTAAISPHDGQADPTKAIAVLRRAFNDAGGTTLVGRASIMIGDPDITVRVGEDRLEAATVVVAAGAETAALLDRLGWEIPMDPSPGLLAVTKPVPPFLNGTVYVYPDDDIAVHLRQLRDGRVVIGERAQDEVATDPTAEHAELLLRRARISFPALEDAELDHFTLEWRPMPRDHMPIVGPLPGIPSIYVATSHSGVTIAPALAEFVAQEIVEGHEVERLKPLRPVRFAARQADAYRSIEEAFSGSPEFFLG
ncbi:MAG TPA: FAD-dependent oxidoreductase [Actinomycetota bacterium]|nr:FAD-dependent oxidoreductase [Actinomycetota bacterium]